MSDAAQGFTFAALAATAIVSGLAVVTTRNVVHAAFWLVPTFAAIAGLYLTLSSQLLFGIQLLVYVGAITVLILFAMMLTQAGRETATGEEASHNSQAPWAVLASLGFLGAVAWALSQQEWWTSPPAIASGYEVDLVGRALFGEYVLLLEGAAILLLAATIAAITLARKETTQE